MAAPDAGSPNDHWIMFGALPEFIQLTDVFVCNELNVAVLQLMSGSTVKLIGVRGFRKRLLLKFGKPNEELTFQKKVAGVVVKLQALPTRFGSFTT